MVDNLEFSENSSDNHQVPYQLKPKKQNKDKKQKKNQGAMFRHNVKQPPS